VIVAPTPPSFIHETPSAPPIPTTSQIQVNAKEEPTIPIQFICPITQDIMTNPCIIADGYTYEYDAILNWIKTGRVVSPMTNIPLKHTNITQNFSLRSAIISFKEEHHML
jgi:hypothetical protein